MTDFQQAVVALLRKNYPDALILTEEAEGGFSAPGFIVLVGEASLKKEMGRRWRRQETVVVWYYPAAGGQPQDLEQPLKVQLFLSQILFMDEEEAALMKKLLLEMGASR